MRRSAALIALCLLIVLSSTVARSQSKGPSIQQLANELSEAYVGKGLGSLEPAHPYFGKLRIVIEHSAADDNDPQRFEIRKFKTLAQGERWLKSRESDDGAPFRGNRELRECKKGVCVYDIVAGIDHRHLYLDRISYGYRKGRFYLKTIYLLDGD